MALVLSIKGTQTPNQRSEMAQAQTRALTVLAMQEDGVAAQGVASVADADAK